MILEWYLAEAHRTVIREVGAGSLAADSTGYSYLRFVRWFDVRTDGFRTRKGWIKLHAVVDIRTDYQCHPYVMDLAKVIMELGVNRSHE